MATISGGKKLEAALRKIAEKVKNGATVRIGFLEGATEPDGTSIPMIAAIQEFGAPKAGIPPRPFFRSMIAAKKGEWPDAIADVLKEKDYDAVQTLKIVGQAIEGQLRESIIATNAPPLSPITLMLRKMRSADQSLVVTGKTVGEAARRVKAGESTAGVSTKPLVDSGTLLGSIDSEVTST